MEEMIEKKMTSDKPKRRRLSKKQVEFFRCVFVDQQSVSNSIGQCKIRQRTFNRWLTDPTFLREIAMNIYHATIQARLEVARSVPLAVCTLSDISYRRRNDESSRRAA